MKKLKTKKKIFFIKNTTFQKIHLTKFNILELSKQYEVYLIDLTGIFKGQVKFDKIKNYKNYIKINKIEDLYNLILKNNPDLIIDMLGNNYLIRTLRIRNFFLKNNLNTLIMRRGLQPHIKFSLIERISINIKNPFYFIKSIYAYLTKHFFKFFFNNLIPNFYISSGYKGDNLRYKIKKYNFYSYDFELTKKKFFKNININNYAVFIDENIVFHPDYFNSNYPNSPATLKYYKSLQNFFTNFEKKYNLKILIALHPSTTKKVEKYFRNFLRFRGITNQLIKNSNLVFIHSSTAKHFAAIYKKPMIYLTSNEIKKSWFQTYISQNSNLFNSQIVNIDNLNFKIKKLNISKVKYQEFISKYVIHPKFRKENKNFLQIINEIIEHE